MEEKPVKYPIGIQDFETIISDGYIYVDKTAILYKLATTGKYYFLSRPRRFGKSLTLSTLKAYFEGKKELFRGLAMESLEKEWRKHPVFLISFARFEKSKEKSLDDILEFYLNDWEEQYDIKKINQTFSSRFAAIIKKSFEVTGEKAVVLIDEYDSALISSLRDPKLHEEMKNILKPFYTVLKDMDGYIKFALLTGITRFSRMTVFSGLNNLKDISLNMMYSEICGITPEELEHYFTTGIKEIGGRYGANNSEMLKLLKDYYDGYHFTEESADIYNPFSILHALDSRKLSNYWFVTGIPSFLVERMKDRDINLEEYMNMRASEGVLQEVDNAYSTDTAILFQAGFLTIKGYDIKNNLYLLGIPNREVKEGMSRLFMEKFLCPNAVESGNLIIKLVRAVEEGNPEQFLTLLKSFFAGIPFDMSKGDKEVYFHNAFYIITNLVGLNVKTEYHTSSGSIDIVISTDNYVYVIELKLNKKPQDALDQINSKDYALPWATGQRKVLKIGAVFSTRTRTLSKWIIQE